LGLGKTGTPSNKKGRQAGRAARRQTKPREGGHTIQQMETRRRQGETTSGHTIKQRETRRGRMGDKGRQDPPGGGHSRQGLGKADTLSSKGKPGGRQGEQYLGKADTPSNKRNKKGDNGRQWETTGDKASGRPARHPTKKEDKLGELRGGRQSLGKADTPSNKWKQEGDKGRQDLGTHHQQEGVEWETKGDKTLREADTPSNKGKQEGRQWETGGGKTSGRQTHHPRKGNEKGEKLETRRDKASGRKDWEGLGRTGKDWQKKMGKTRKDWERVGRTVKDQEGLRKDWDRSWKGRTGKE